LFFSFKRIIPADKQHLRWFQFRNEGGDRILNLASVAGK
jgi:hypothetical protein